MAFTFLAALGHEIGASLVDLSLTEECRQLLASSTRIVLPTDVVASNPGAPSPTRTARTSARRLEGARL